MKSPDGLPYRFIKATHDYGKSPVAKQGIVVHLSEGCNPAAYLSGGNVLRGVSANFTVEQDGEVIQMLAVDHTSGSINVNDVRRDTDEDGFWGRRWTRYYNDDILTGKANQRTISIEVAGRASKRWGCDGETYPPGPNPEQVTALIELIGVLRGKFAQRLGVNGHRDFADYKPCPGRGVGIERLLENVGHGPEVAPDPDPEPDCLPQRKRIRELKAEVEELQDALAEAAVNAQQSFRDLRPYLPDPNE